MATQKVRRDPGIGERRTRRRQRRHAYGSIGVAALVAFVFIVIAASAFTLRSGEPKADVQPAQRSGTDAKVDRPASSPTRTRHAPAAPPGAGPYATGADAGSDYLVDIDTRATTRLPKSIRSSGRNGYAVSPDGSEVAFSGRGDDGRRQVFIARLDGTRIRQVTHGLPRAAVAGWSPDGTELAYIGRGSDGVDEVFVVDLKTGRTSRVTFETFAVEGATFSPDGTSIVYTAHRPGGDEVLIVPVAGGRASTLIEVGGSWIGSSGVAFSPDGSLLAYGCGAPGWDASLCLANADGTDPGVMIVPGEAGSNIKGATWSPDGSRLAYWVLHNWAVFVLDVKSGEKTVVAKGAWPDWVDDHTLIVEPYTGPR
jgi:Tol biopolymer transport system component